MKEKYETYSITVGILDQQREEVFLEKGGVLVGEGKGSCHVCPQTADYTTVEPLHNDLGTDESGRCGEVAVMGR